MGKVMSVLRWCDKYVEEIISSVCIATIATCVFLQFAIRFFTGAALAWPEELAIYAMAWAMYIGGSMSVREKGHMRILVGIQHLPRKLAISILMIGDFIWFIFNIFMVFVGIDYIKLLIDQPMISPALHIDQVYPQSIIAIGFGMMAFRLLQHYIIWFKDGCPGLPA